MNTVGYNEHWWCDEYALLIVNYSLKIKENALVEGHQKIFKEIFNYKPKLAG